jgi:hypothetical protein
MVQGPAPGTGAGRTGGGWGGSVGSAGYGEQERGDVEDQHQGSEEPGLGVGSASAAHAFARSWMASISRRSAT